MATRRERVVLDLQDNLSAKMLGAAGATAVLDGALERLDGSVVDTQKQVDVFSRSGGLANLGRGGAQATKEIDRMSGRLSILLDTAVSLGPAFVPITGVAIPAVTGLAASLGIAATAGGVLVGVMQGVGTALETVNAAALEPTQANLEKARKAMEDLTPAGRDLVTELRRFGPELTNLRDVGQNLAFPGFILGLRELEGALPRVESIVAAVSRELGDIAADTGASLASDRWAPFLDFLAAEAPKALDQMASAAGNLAAAMAQMWMAFDPLNDDFLGFLVRSTADLERWAERLPRTESFQEFVAYIRTEGPQVAATFGAIGDAAVQIVQAISPLGGPTLRILESVAEMVSAIADSPIGVPLAALAVGLASLRNVSRASDVLGRSMSSASTSAKGLATDLRLIGSAGVSGIGKATREVNALATAEKRLSVGGAAKGAAALTGLGLAATGAADSFGLTNTASLALAGTMAGPWGAAVGGGVGLLLDISESHKRASEEAQGFIDTLDAETGALTAVSDEWFAHALAVDFLGERLEKVGISAQDALDYVTGLKDASDFDLGRKQRGQLDGLDPIRDKFQQFQEERRIASDIVGSLSGIESGYTSELERQLVAIEGLIAATDALRGARATARDADLAWREQLLRTNGVIKEFGKVLGENGKARRGTGEDGLRAEGELNRLRDAFVRVRDTTGASTEKLLAMREQWIENAVQMGITRDAARRLANQLLGTPKQLKLDARQANRELKRLRDEASKTITIPVRAVGVSGFGPQAPGFKTGGWTGSGNPNDVAGVTHQREWVVRDPYASRYAPILRQMNAGTYRPNVSVSTPGFDYARLADAIASTRGREVPFIGKMVVNEGDYDRRSAQLRKLMTYGGRRP